MELDLLFLKKTPPHSPEAEKTVLGGILVNPRNLNVVLSTVSPEDFYRDANRNILTTIARMVDRGLPVELLSLSEELRREGALEGPGARPTSPRSWTAFPATSMSNTTPRSSRKKPFSGG